MSSFVEPIGLGRRKSYSVPSTDVGADREAALVRPEHGPPRRAQDHRVDRLRPDGQVRVGAAPYGQVSLPTLVAVVRTRSPSFGERVLDAERERERIARLRMEHVLHARLGSARARPTVHAAQRTRPWIAVRVLGLGQRELVAPPLELVAAVLEPVRPRDQHLPPSRGAHLVGAVSVEELPAARRVRAQPAADLDDHGPLVARAISICSPDGAVISGVDPA